MRVAQLDRPPNLQARAESRFQRNGLFAVMPSFQKIISFEVGSAYSSYFCCPLFTILFFLQASLTLLKERHFEDKYEDSEWRKVDDDD